MPSNNKFIYAINECSLKIYDGIMTKKIKIEDIYEIVKNKTLNINIEYEISDNKLKKMYSVLNKEEIFDEILYITEDKYKHLKDVKELVNIDSVINYSLTDELFAEKVKLYYTDKIVDLLLENYYDYEDVKILGRLKQDINSLDQRINTKIMKKISEFYVKRITI